MLSRGLLIVLCLGATAIAATAIAAPATRPTTEPNQSWPSAEELGLAPHAWIDAVAPEPGPPLELPSYADTIDRAAAEVRVGRYRRALLTLHQAAGDIKVKDKPRAQLVRAEALLSLGRLDDAAAQLAATELAGNAKADVLRIRVLLAAGRNKDAAEAARAIIKSDPASIAGHYYLGAALEAAADINGARDAYAWFDAGAASVFENWLAKEDRAFDDPEQVTLIGRAMQRWAMLSGEYERRPSLHEDILNVFVRVYDVIDREYWPAHLAAARFCLEHDDSVKAGQELSAALALNPNDTEALELAGRMALSGLDFDRCDSIVDSMRRVDPNSRSADLLEVRSLLAARDAVGAERLVRRVMANRPDDRDAMALLASALAIQLKDGASAEVVAKARALWPQDATVVAELAQQLSTLRQYDRAAAAYKTAIQLAPWWTEPRNGLGLLYTQSGDETAARDALTVAHNLDPYNLETTNYLRLLDELDAFARKRTAHFLICYDAKADPIIPDYFGDCLESIYSDVTSQYQTEPTNPTSIEVFPTHAAFSVRTSGLPWIGTVGACTGRVIALVSPRADAATMGNYNWAQVLRHEFTHTITLAATGNRIPHWMTEGLAVYEEHAPLRWEWVPMLYDAVSKDSLFPLQRLTWAFIRPRRPNDRQLGFAEALWICTYIEQTYGHESMLKLLAAFKAGASQEQAFPQVLGKSLDSFFDGFRAWTVAQISTWGYDPETSKKYAALRERGELLIAQQQYVEAAKIWEQIAAIRPVDELPHQRLAGLYGRSALNQPEKEIAQLQILDAEELKDNRYCKRIARVYRESGKLDEASHFALRAVYMNPYDVAAHELLADVAERAHDDKTATRERAVLAKLAEWQAQKPASP